MAVVKRRPRPNSAKMAGNGRRSFGLGGKLGVKKSC